MKELKPCPFCGGAGNLIGAREDCEGRFTAARVICPKCRFEIVGAYRKTTRGWASDDDYNNSEKTAIAKWNRRIASDSISRCELFNRLATIPAPPEANDFKAEIYKVIQSMEAKQCGTK